MHLLHVPRQDVSIDSFRAMPYVVGMNAHATPTARGLPARPRQLVILAICCVSVALVSLDVTIVNVALPAIRSELHASIAGLQWSIDGYSVIVASLLLLAGSLADRFGRRRTFQVGLCVFSLGSLLCSLAPTTSALVAFRMLQAVGGSMLNPVAMSIIVNTFLDPRDRARAIGVWGAVFGVSMAVGPPLGGLLVETIGWRSIFWVNVPFGIAAIVLAARFVPESRADRPRRFDPVAQALVIIGLLALTAAVIDGRRVGWTSWPIAAGFATAIACVTALIAWESRRREPMLDLRLFRSLPFSAATLTAVIAFAAFNGFLFLNSLYLQESRGMRASTAGLATLPIAVALMVCSPLSGRLVGAGRVRLVLVMSGIAMTTGALLLTQLTSDTSLAHLVAAYGIFGVGLGTVNAPITNTAVSGMPRSQAALASAVASTSRQVGASLGVALAGSLASAGIESAHHPEFANATHVVFWVIAGFGAAIAALGLASTGARAKASAERVAFQLDPRAAL
ncbi:MAG TPA: DHA2 family efflux MFS transporter permease subunit [Kofleriaceae bacterium]|nr:DHA2 family efflux MFS transporter permease subunit [Kofleriaceae bacterium]